LSSAVRAPIIKVWSNRHHTRRLNSDSLYLSINFIAVYHVSDSYYCSCLYRTWNWYW
jgi:hypothetical protein